MLDDGMMEMGDDDYDPKDNRRSAIYDENYNSSDEKLEIEGDDEMLDELDEGTVELL